ncbi:flagellar protein FlaG [Bordetella sp. FB-8]|uniref:flagellar protein FlaG n=1 Tax=Bordetella sp. FB-8 TaxID=1159870 RepID=UPI0003703DBB|nr:flagellar protein FlaG [Bordetella sp. FB-8]
MDILSITPPAATLPLPQVAATIAATAQPIAPTTGASEGRSTDGSTSQQQQNSSESSVHKALQSVNDQLQAWSTKMKFTIDPNTHQVVVDIIDPQTGKTISTIPSETMLRVAKMIAKFQGNAVKTVA